MNAAILICGTTTMLSSCASESDNPVPVDPASVATDYSDEEHWLALPEITKDVDAFYIYDYGCAGRIRNECKCV